MHPYTYFNGENKINLCLGIETHNSDDGDDTMVVKLQMICPCSPLQLTCHHSPHTLCSSQPEQFAVALVGHAASPSGLSSCTSSVSLPSPHPGWFLLILQVSA